MGARLEKVGQVWRRVKPYLLGVLVVVVVAGAISALYYVPMMQVPICSPGQDGLPPKICFDIENEARQTLAYILGGILAIIGIYMAHRRIRALERQVQLGQEQLQVAEEGQITERFTRAIEQLGSDKMEIRLGGIYALERIANDSDKDYWPIIETLTAYVREIAPWREPLPDSPVPKDKIKPTTDIQAILTVLSRRKYRSGQKEEKGRLDLRNTDLRRADLGEARLDRANLRAAHLERAYLKAAHLERARLGQAHLERADLRKARLEGAFIGAAHLKGADLREANLEGADLRKATGLTREQLAQAILDEKTKLPDYLQEQPPKVKGPEGSSEE
jgi:hypothetical protein